jgi:hypothetical protein
MLWQHKPTTRCDLCASPHGLVDRARAPLVDDAIRVTPRTASLRQQALRMKAWEPVEGRISMKIYH